MTAERCPRCDRAECPRVIAEGEFASFRLTDRPLRRRGVEEWQRRYDALDLAVERGIANCAAHAVHAVDWRSRALAAEQRAEAAEARETRLRAVVASLADQWQREADSEPSCRLGTGRRAGLLSCRRDLRAALATAEGKESDRG